MKFDAKVSLAEQLTKFEEVIREYERISGGKYNEDLMFSTLIQACPSALQVQIHMSLNDKSTYTRTSRRRCLRMSARPQVAPCPSFV